LALYASLLIGYPVRTSFKRKFTDARFNALIWLLDWLIEFIHSFIPSFIPSFIYLIHWLIEFIHSFIPSFIPSFIYLIDWLIEFIHSFIPSFIPSFLHSFTWLIDWLNSFIHSFIPSFIPSFIYLIDWLTVYARAVEKVSTSVSVVCCIERRNIWTNEKQCRGNTLLMNRNTARLWENFRPKWDNYVHLINMFWYTAACVAV